MSNWKTSIPSLNAEFKTSIPRSKTEQNNLTNTVGTIKQSSIKAGFTRKNRENHTHILGGTGSGKSKLMELLIREDIQNNKAGLMLIDPHGTLYRDVLLFASHRYPRLAERFVLFNPSEQNGHTVGFNPIITDSHKIDYVIDNLVLACLKAFGQEDTVATPRITKWLINIFYTLIVNQLTLLESAPLLSTNPENTIRDLLINNVSNELVKEDWGMFIHSNQNQKQNLIEGAANRLRKFLSSDIIRSIIGQKENSLNISDAMEQGKIILVNLHGKDSISRENTQLLGTLLVNEVYRCAINRNDFDRNLKPFYVYIDEFAQFVTRDIAYGLEETRKFKVFFTLAHQHLAQLKKDDEYLYASVMTNCKNKIVFGALSVDDAKVMAEELNTGFLDLKSVKDEMYRIRERHIEETRKVVTQSLTETEGSSWQDTEGVSEGTSNTSGNSESNTVGNSSGYSSGYSSSYGDTKGSNGGYSYRNGYYSNGINSQSNSNSTSSSYGSSHSDSYSNSASQSSTYNESNSSSYSTNQSHSKGGNSSIAKGESIAEVPFHRVEEVEELSSRSFWSINELMHMETGKIKNQETANAYFKMGSQDPFQCEIKRVNNVHFHPIISPRKVKTFIEKSIEGNKDCCLPFTEAKKLYQKRQELVFGQPLLFDDYALISSSHCQVKLQVQPVIDIEPVNTKNTGFNDD